MTLSKYNFKLYCNTILSARFRRRPRPLTWRRLLNQRLPWLPVQHLSSQLQLIFSLHNQLFSLPTIDLAFQFKEILARFNDFISLIANNFSVLSISWLVRHFFDDTQYFAVKGTQGVTGIRMDGQANKTSRSFYQNHDLKLDHNPFWIPFLFIVYWHENKTQLTR